MKKSMISILLIAFSIAHADCSSMPVGMDLAKSIEAKEMSKAKELLLTYKADIKAYLAACDQSKEKFEETSVMIHTYEDRLADVEYDMKHANTTDCSKVPDGTKLTAAFKSKNSADIKAHYESYSKNAKEYIDNCASHAEYETVYESSMFFEEEFASVS